MNKIVLITTKGCDSCAVMRRSINEAIYRTRKELEFESKDFESLDKKYIKTIGLRDFPTTLFYKDDRLVRKEIGSHPTIVVLRWIDIDFK